MNETSPKSFFAQFQTFDDPPEAAESAPRVAALRAELARRGLDGFIVPHADRHQNEYLPPSEERLAWLTGFTGSAGAAIVLADRAVLFVDGRYTLQARDQADPKLFTIEHLVDKPPSAWIEANARRRAEARLRSLAAHRGRRRTSRQGLRRGRRDPGRDRAQSDRRGVPQPPSAAARRRGAARPANSPASPRRKSSSASAPRSRSSRPMRWSSPIRMRSPGPSTSAAPMSPTRRCRSPSRIITAGGGARLYIEERKLTDAARGALAGLAEIKPAEAFAAGPRERSAPSIAPCGSTRRPPRTPSRRRITGQRRQGAARPRPDRRHEGGEERGRDRRQPRRPSPRRRRGGEIPRLVRSRGAAGRGSPRSTPSRRWRPSAATPGCCKDVSFSDHFGLRARTAPSCIIASPARSNRSIVPGELFLVDSGAQYLDGTTDITRTVTVGEADGGDARPLHPRAQGPHRHRPRGVSGRHRRIAARQLRARHLWAAGLDFDHGTGHGVGSYLSVHEGPARISKLGTAALMRGMILSNEPGYYKHRPLRHPHRKPGAGHRGAGGRRAAKSRSTASRR